MSKASKDTPGNAGSSGSQPPSYQAAGQPPYQPYASQQPVLLQRINTYRRSPARRFWATFAVAIFVWVLLSALVRSWYGLVHWGDGFLTGEFPVPSDVALSRCVVGEHDWSHFPYPHAPDPSSTNRDRFPHSSSTTFELPLSYDTLFLLARGSHTRGTVNVITSDEVSDTVKVHLTVQYMSKDIRDRAIKVCLLEREDNSIGVGYFTRGSWRHFNPSVYEATVVIPVSSQSKLPRHINNFKTDMDNTMHSLGDLQDLVSFSYISLRGSNSPIYSKSIFADTTVFRTSNGAITGSYNASRSLTLHTSNAPIQVDVSVENASDYVSDLTLHTSNGKIDSRVSLTSATDDGRYMITATTSNAPLAVGISTSPLASTLRVTASTSNGPAFLSLPPAYEGQISMSTSNGAPSIKRRNVADPSGKGRERKVRTTSLGRNTLRGSVSWTDEEGSGTVALRSSNSPIVIQL
ncbi:hypothetical protein C0991_000796 [Blastosporella zonata]|nr:hypothetical protein C0991_000796 [Blastosporella zonata]